MIYVLTGPVGSGKSMMATAKVIDYASQGRRVAANYHVDLAPVCLRSNSQLSSTAVNVLPSIPTSADLERLGVGGPAEDRAGLVVIDEAGTFLNARTWSEQDRQNIIRWFLLSRKRRWDVILIVQAVGILDKQIREAVVEVCGRIRRTDRVKIPMTKVALPRFHVAAMRYGTNPNDVIIERWVTRGAEAIKCYDTTSLFENQAGAYSVLPATLSKWRYQARRPLVQLPRVVAVSLMVALWPIWAAVGRWLDTRDRAYLVGWPSEKSIAKPRRRPSAPVSTWPSEAELVAAHARLWYSCLFPKNTRTV